MEQFITPYLAAVKADYFKWMNACDPKDGSRDSEYVKEQLKEFDDGIVVTTGKKFIKIVSRGSVHSFIVKEDGPKFKRGDILKAASWAAPAQNFARGNVIVGAYESVRWTGA